MRSQLLASPKCRPSNNALNKAISSGAQKLNINCRAAPSDVFVLDMDGVLVDSEPEVSTAGLRAAFEYWPDAYKGKYLEAVLEEQAESMRALRPFMVNGVEAMLLARLLQEGISVEDIQSSWHEQLHAGYERFESQTALEPWFERFRTQWMEEHPEEYRAINKVYPGVASALMMCEQPYYIASSKKANRVSKLATDVLKLKGFEEDSPRLFAGLLPPNERKAETLRAIMERGMCQDASTTLHFVDDRCETLLHIAEQPELQRWKLYFADWGYSTPEDKKCIAAQSRVRPLSLIQFGELLKWCVVMGVDDGCEPEPEEVQAMIAEDMRRR